MAATNENMYCGANIPPINYSFVFISLEFGLG